ncbi:hypothetical protein [Lacinutrix sp. Bg11-31]|uniref:hypothetical protein n=1 Tax=Lacinutrix sp. Bg11-31 TaxID=2057808 RepID=UPI000C303545|nr:hypothetical protein [Lacinutrix sp. Bg11-31]AUC80782.1 hypothetical protein CW733_00980 [Lacinutrix sp. Bg11-31]
MLDSILDLFITILDFFTEFKFWKKKKARRKLEKEKKLPKKVMIHPYLKLLLIFLIIILPIKLVLGYFLFTNKGESNTTEKIIKIEEILEHEKKSLGVYPKKLTAIIRNNPLRKNMTLDYWNNEFFYEQTEQGLNYILISKGKDGILKTKDDVSLNKL